MAQNACRHFRKTPEIKQPEKQQQTNNFIDQCQGMSSVACCLGFGIFGRRRPRDSSHIFLRTESLTLVSYIIDVRSQVQGGWSGSCG